MKEKGQRSWGTSIHLLRKYLWKFCQATLRTEKDEKIGENHTSKCNTRTAILEVCSQTRGTEETQ